MAPTVDIGDPNYNQLELDRAICPRFNISPGGNSSMNRPMLHKPARVTTLSPLTQYRASCQRNRQHVKRQRMGLLRRMWHVSPLPSPLSMTRARTCEYCQAKGTTWGRENGRSGISPLSIFWRKKWGDRVTENLNIGIPGIWVRLLCLIGYMIDYMAHLETQRFSADYQPYDFSRKKIKPGRKQA
jgi:hypothetical protein